MEDKYRGERVLVYPRAILESLGVFDGFCSNVDRYLSPILDSSNTHFHLRSLAEENESLKQVIPYVVFCCGREVFSYVRGKSAGETRLVGNRSIGIGGHINPADEQIFAHSHNSDFSTYNEALQREINEEVIVDEPLNLRTIGLINDDSNPVGRVHFGIVHLCVLKNRSVRKREQQITQAGFVRIDDFTGVRKNELESWSQFCADFIADYLP